MVALLDAVLPTSITSAGRGGGEGSGGFSQADITKINAPKSNRFFIVVLLKVRASSLVALIAAYPKYCSTESIYLLTY